MMIEGDGEGPPNTGSTCWTPGGERKENNTPAGCSLLAPGLAVGFHGLFLRFYVKRQGPI